MRERFDENDETTREAGAVTEKELGDIRKAYADGCKGEILIGMRGEERVITMLLPSQIDPEELSSKYPKLKKLGCDRWVRIYRTM